MADVPIEPRGASSGGVPAPAPVPGTLPGGATLRVGTQGWVLLDERPAAALGRALVWADRDGIDELHVLVEGDDAAATLARRSTAFAPAPVVWQVDGRSVRRAVAAAPPPPGEPPAVARELVGLLVDAGVDVVVEHGEIRGEVLGLEVARIVVDHPGDQPDAAHPGDRATARIEVGVGRNDREAFAIIHGDVPTPDALRLVVDKVRRHRRVDAEAHPLGRMAAERWLRSIVIEAPATVGAARLLLAEATVARQSLQDVACAVAVGQGVDGRAVVVACSVGIDLDLIPAAADARLAHAPDARLVVVVPERDDHPVTRRLAAALVDPADIVAVPGDWRRSLGVGPSGGAS